MPGFGFSEPLIEIASNAAHILRRAASTQGGVIAGEDPINFKPTDPLRLWTIQVALVVVMTQVLSLALRSLRQPRVISEVLCGVILGPTLLGRIPHFSDTIFPAESIPFLTLTANIGLVLFLFLVGLEIDTRLIKKNAKFSVAIAFSGMVLPFGMGAGVAVGVYDRFADKEQVQFGHFLLFVGVAFAITAFPVLCRILTELHLLETTVGIIVLSAGVVCDIAAWVLLALAVSLANASSGLTALWVLLAATAFSIFILIPIRWGFVRLARATGSLEEGQPSAFLMTVTILLVFVSAFITDILGVHPVFGGFLAGLVIPHESGFAIALVEKLEDLVSLLFLPVYFTLSGLNTDLGLLNNGATWGYTILICVVAWTGKFFGAGAAARFLKFSWRESGAIGMLMSCKGLVELIVLNIGLQAGILDTRIFSMFVLEALLLTFITTPVTLAIYPPKYRCVVGASRPKPQGGDEEDQDKKQRIAHLSTETTDILKKKLTLLVNKVEHLSALMVVTQLLRPRRQYPISVVNSTSPLRSDKRVNEKRDIPSTSSDSHGSPKVTIDALRLIELSERASALMMSSVTEELLAHDPLLSALRTFARLHRIPVTSSTLSVVPQEEFAAKIAERAIDVNTDLVVIPWSTSTHPVVEGEVDGPTVFNPFEAVFGRTSGIREANEKSASVVYSHFVRRVFALSSVDVALFVEREIPLVETINDLDVDSDNATVMDGTHIFLPWFGGPDDRLALSLVVQMCANQGVRATVIRYTKTEPDSSPERMPQVTHEGSGHIPTVGHSTAGFPDTVYGPQTTQHRLESETADNLIWNRYAEASEETLYSSMTREALTRISFEEVSTPFPLRASLDKVNTFVASGAPSSGTEVLIAMVGRGRRMAVESHEHELQKVLESSNIDRDVRRTVGDVGTAFIVASDVGILVLQAAHASEDV